MPWLYFNPEDNSLACRFDSKPSQAWIKRAVPQCIEVFKEEVIMPEGCEDEAGDLWLFDDGSVGVDYDTVRFGTKRFIRQNADYLQMYAPLPDADRPANFQDRVTMMTGYVPKTMIDAFLSDRVITDEEKTQMLQAANAL